MEITYSRIDVEAYIGQPPPHDIQARHHGETWLIPHEPVRFDQPVQWFTHRRDDHVYIPLCPYLVSTTPELAMAFMAQLGVYLAADLPKPARRLHIAIGSPLHVVQDGDTMLWQIQCGFGIVLR